MPQTSCCISDPAPPTCRETTGDNGRQRETRPLQSPRSRPHQPTPAPHEGRQPETMETTGDKTTSEPKKPTTPTNTQPPHEGRQPETTETRPLQSPRSRPHQPTPNPHMKGDNRRQRRQDHFRAQEADHTNQHPPPT